MLIEFLPIIRGHSKKLNFNLVKTEMYAEVNPAHITIQIINKPF